MTQGLKTVAEAIWRAAFRSATMLWSYFLLAWSFVLANLDSIAAALGDPQLNQQITAFVGGSPKALALYTGAVSFITMAARARTLIKPKD